MSATQNDLLKLQNTTEEPQQNNKPSSSELVEKEHFEGTGFDIVGNKEIGYFVALGQYRLTPSYRTKKEIKLKIHNRDWELLIGLIGACIQATQLENKIEQMQKDIKDLTEKARIDKEIKFKNDIEDQIVKSNSL